MLLLYLEDFVDNLNSPVLKYLFTVERSLCAKNSVVCSVSV